MSLNEKLAELRKARGLTQQEIAEALKVSRQAVSRWEVGTAAPSLDNLVLLGKLYGMPLDDLIQQEAGKPEETSEIVPVEIPADVLPEVLETVPAAASAGTGRSYITPVCAFLAVLILADERVGQ